MSFAVDISLKPSPPLRCAKGSRAGRSGVSIANRGSYNGVRPVVEVAVERGKETGMALWINFDQLCRKGVQPDPPSGKHERIAVQRLRTELW